MDLSVFAKENFVVKDWINSVFQQNEAQANPENYASSVVMKLQLAIYEISSGLETMSGMVVQSLPRLLRDVDLLQQEVHHFQQKMKTVQQEASVIEKETTNSVKNLMKLDTLKTKIKATSKALQEADNWTTLMADIEELFESADLPALSQRLNSLRQSLELLSHVNDYNDRLLQLDGLRNRLEALASPHLVAAISAADANKTSSLVQVFTNMDRLEQLLHYYSKCRRGVVLQQWKQLNEIEDSNIIEIINQFYDVILNDLQDQTKWCNTVFQQRLHSVNSILLPVYTQVLSSLEPSPLHSLEVSIKKVVPGDGLGIIQHLKSCADRLAHGIEAHFRDVERIDDDILSHFGDSLYQPFRLLLCNKYRMLTYQYLVEQLPQVNQGKTRDEVVESIHLLKQTHSKINSLIESSFSNCMTLTNGSGLQLLVQSWNQLLSSYLQNFKTLLEGLRNLQQPNDDLLHAGLLLLQTLGELLILLEENDAQLAVSFKTAARKLKESTSPLNQFTMLYLDSEAYKRLEQLFAELHKDPGYSVLKQIIAAALDLNADIQSCVFDMLVTPVQQQLGFLGNAEWMNVISSSGLTEDLPEFGLAPLEYITQVGQYLMMLPQHLEPFVLQENKGLARALKEQVFTRSQSDNILLLHGHSPTVADILLSSVAKATGNALGEAILRIPTLGAKAAKQVAADIDYLGNIFEDLGLSLPSNLSNIRDLLRAAAKSLLTSDLSVFRTASQNKPARLVAAVRTMCNLPSSD